MSEDLQELFVDVTGEETTTEHQEDQPSYDPVEEDEAEIVETVAEHAQDDGLGDAVAGAETGAGDGGGEAST